MKIGILSTNKNLYSTRRLVEAGIERGHEMPVINHKRCYMNIASNEPEFILTVRQSKASKQSSPESVHPFHFTELLLCASSK